MRRPPRFTRTDTLFACTARFRSGRGPDRGPVPFTPGAEPGGDGIGAVEVSRGVRRRAGEDDAVVDQDHLVTDTRTGHGAGTRSEEHTSELQSLMRSSYAVFCLKKKKQQTKTVTRMDTHNQH